MYAIKSCWAFVHKSWKDPFPIWLNTSTPLIKNFQINFLKIHDCEQTWIYKSRNGEIGRWYWNVLLQFLYYVVKTQVECLRLALIIGVCKISHFFQCWVRQWGQDFSFTKKEDIFEQLRLRPQNWRLKNLNRANRVQLPSFATL